LQLTKHYSQTDVPIFKTNKFLLSKIKVILKNMANQTVMRTEFSFLGELFLQGQAAAYLLLGYCHFKIGKI